jgi:hypothetical protein
MTFSLQLFDGVRFIGILHDFFVMQFAENDVHVFKSKRKRSVSSSCFLIRVVG